LIYIVLVSIIAVLGFGLWWERRAYRLLEWQWRDTKRALDEVVEVSKEQMTLTWTEAKKSVAEAEEARARAESALEVFVKYEQGLLEGLSNNERLLVAQALANERLSKERDDTAEEAHLTALRFGNAQNMLIRALGDILRGYNAYRAAHGDKPIELDQGLQQIMKERDQT
jgi:hypothetical protein